MYENSKKREHDKEMRILGLFDSIGLNKQYYDSYMDYLINDNASRLLESVEFTKSEQEDIERQLSLIDCIIKKPIDEVDSYLYKIKRYKKNQKDGFIGMDDPEEESISNTINKCYDINSEIIKYKSKCKKALKSLSLTEITIDEIDKYAEEKNLLKDFKNDKSNKWIKLWRCTCLISLFLMILLLAIGKYNSSLMGWSTGTCIFSLIAFFIMIGSSCQDCEELERLLEKQLEIPDKILNEKKIIDEFNKLKKTKQEDLSKLDKKIKGINQEIKKEILPKWNNFVEFRKSHYNSQFEKLLLDLDLKQQIEELDIDYPKINNGNKTGDGNIDDYIEYFDNLID